MARRDDREYWACLREDQRSKPGCPARELCDESLFREPASRRSGSTPATHCQDALARLARCRPAARLDREHRRGLTMPAGLASHVPWFRRTDAPQPQTEPSHLAAPNAARQSRDGRASAQQAPANAARSATCRRRRNGV